MTEPGAVISNALAKSTARLSSSILAAGSSGHHNLQERAIVMTTSSYTLETGISNPASQLSTEYISVITVIYSSSVTSGSKTYGSTITSYILIPTPTPGNPSSDQRRQANVVNNWYFFILGVGTILIVALIWYWRYRKRSKQRQAEQARRDALQRDIELGSIHTLTGNRVTTPARSVTTSLATSTGRHWYSDSTSAAIVPEHEDLPPYTPKAPDY